MCTYCKAAARDGYWVHVARGVRSNVLKQVDAAHATTRSIGVHFGYAGAGGIKFGAGDPKGVALGNGARRHHDSLSVHIPYANQGKRNCH